MSENVRFWLMTSNQHVQNSYQSVATSTRYFLFTMFNRTYNLVITNVPVTATITFTVIPDDEVPPQPSLYVDPITTDTRSQIVVTRQPNASELYRNHGMAHCFEPSVSTQNHHSHHTGQHGYHQRGQMHDFRVNTVPSHCYHSPNQYEGVTLNYQQPRGRQIRRRNVEPYHALHQNNGVTNIGYRRFVPPVPWCTIHRQHHTLRPLCVTARITDSNHTHSGNRGNIFSGSGQLGYLNNSHRNSNTMLNRFSNIDYSTLRHAHFRFSPPIIHSDIRHRSTMSPFSRTFAYGGTMPSGAPKQSFHHPNRTHSNYNVNQNIRLLQSLHGNQNRQTGNSSDSTDDLTNNLNRIKTE